SVIIFPNPATSEIKIENAKSKIVLVEIYDVMGGKVFKSRILNPDSQISVDVSALKPGIYFLTVKQNQSVTTRKIVIQ
ncbi:MAG TPA: T9SS type A sorting domain-containing protein, partial [Bacteroidia bacterium]|nr:T9SS type A sorting domain-containing protein [Bacteroidia bacterium]